MMIIHTYISSQYKFTCLYASGVLSGTIKFYFKFTGNIQSSIFLPDGTCSSAVCPVVCISPRQQMSLSGRGVQANSPDGVQAKWTGIGMCWWPGVTGIKVIRPSIHTPITPPFSSDLWIRSSLSRDSSASLAEFWSISDTTKTAGFTGADCGTGIWCSGVSNRWHFLWRSFITGFNIYKNAGSLVMCYSYKK